MSFPFFKISIIDFGKSTFRLREHSRVNHVAFLMISNVETHCIKVPCCRVMESNSESYDIAHKNFERCHCILLTAKYRLTQSPFDIQGYLALTFDALRICTSE